MLVSEAMSFAAEMIAFSEPLASTSVEPKPNLVRAAYDDDAIAAAAEEMGYDRPDYDDEEPEDFEP